MTFSKEYTKGKGVSIKSVHIFISGSGDSDKSHLVKTIYNTVVETLLLNYEEPEKPRVQNQTVYQ